MYRDHGILEDRLTRLERQSFKQSARIRVLEAAQINVDSIPAKPLTILDDKAILADRLQREQGMHRPGEED